MFRHLLIKASAPHAELHGIVAAVCGTRVPTIAVIEEGKKVCEEDGEQAGSSATDTASLGDYKYYGRGWIRPAKLPKNAKQLPEEKKPVVADAGDGEEGKDWLYANDEMLSTLADKVAELIASISADEIDRAVDSTTFDDSLFYDPEDDEEIDDTPYEMDGFDDEADLDDDAEDDDEPTQEEQAAVIRHVVQESQSFTIVGDPLLDSFAVGLDKLLSEEIGKETAVSKTELVRRKIVAGRRMKRMAGKMRSGRKRKFFRTDMETIKKRVHHAALNALKDKFAKNKGGRYQDLSLSSKVDVDMMLKKHANMIPTIERKLMSGYRAKLAQRRRAHTEKH